MIIVAVPISVLCCDVMTIKHLYIVYIRAAIHYLIWNEYKYFVQLHSADNCVDYTARGHVLAMNHTCMTRYICLRLIFV